MNESAKMQLMLAMVVSCIKMIEINKLATPETENIVAVAKRAALKAFDEHKSSGDKKRMRYVLKRWSECGADMDEWHPLVLATMGLNLVEDMLAGEVSGSAKANISAIAEALRPLSYHWADKGEYRHLKEAGEMVEQIYRLIKRKQ